MTPAISSLVPHAGSMCLLGWIIRWDEQQVVAGATSHRDPLNPLRRHGRLDPVALCEYGAQAMAVHGGLLAQRDGAAAARPGMLVSLRDVSLAACAPEQLDGHLEVCASRLHGDALGWQYAFTVSHARRVLASGRAAVMLRGD